MNNKQFSVLFACLLLVACGNNPSQTTTNNTDTAAQEEVVTDEAMAEDIPDEIDENPYEEFVPKGYTLYNAYKGDLNRDDYEDAIIILEPLNNPDDMTNRAVALLVGDAEGKLSQVAYCANAVLCKECGGTFGDPFSDVVIKNGYFTLEHYGGSSYRWTHDPTFKYNAADGR
ncbi:MAG: hypothetical protein R2800_12655 [Flavipsychrobacter sp.]